LGREPTDRLLFAAKTDVRCAAARMPQADMIRDRSAVALAAETMR
jgi:hypothetical protein